MSGMSRGILLYRSVEFPDPMERGTIGKDGWEGIRFAVPWDLQIPRNANRNYSSDLEIR